jgi:hypothetical protein
MFAVKVQGVVVQTKSRTFPSPAIRFRRVTLDSCDWQVHIKGDDIPNAKHDLLYTLTRPQRGRSVTKESNERDGSDDK